MGIPVEDAENSIVRVSLLSGHVVKGLGLFDDRHGVCSDIIIRDIYVEGRDTKRRSKVPEVKGFGFASFTYDQAAFCLFSNLSRFAAGEIRRFLGSSPESVPIVHLVRCPEKGNGSISTG